MTSPDDLWGVAYTDGKHRIIRAEIIVAPDDFTACNKAWASMPRRARDFQLVTDPGAVASGLPAIVTAAEAHLRGCRRD